MIAMRGDGVIKGQIYINYITITLPKAIEES
jgi:hypothetical protein